MPIPVNDTLATESPGGAIPKSSGIWPPEGLGCLRFRESVITLTISVKTLCIPYAANRVLAHLFTASTAGSVVLATNIQNLTAFVGQYMDYTNPFLRSWSTHGPACNQQWYALSTASFAVMLHEIFYQPPCGMD